MVTTKTKKERMNNMGLGKIIVIKEETNVVTTHESERFDGYAVRTDKHDYFLLISNGQKCCEKWGYFESQDDLSYFLGAELLEVSVTDTALNKRVFEGNEHADGWLREDECMFVDFSTDKGLFQLAVYNSDNGYYGHDVLLLKDSAKIEQTSL